MNDTLPLVVANFKANQTWDDLEVWLEKVNPLASTFTGTIIVCPSSPFISEASQKIKNLNSKLKLGGQDISRFEQGAFTGEYAASQVADQISYAIVGHSERRNNFGESDEILAAKVNNAQKAGINPIFCVGDSKTSIPENVKIVAYEPTFAIGTGNPDTPQNAHEIAKQIKDRKECAVIYGGSVTAQNAKGYLEKGVIDGLLIGSFSLDPLNFLNLLNSVSY